MPDTSLDDFIGGEGSASEYEPEEETVDEETVESGDEPVAGDGDGVDDGEGAVEPAVSTYDFAPEGAPCAACGVSVERRWRAEAGLVCPDCKEW